MVTQTPKRRGQLGRSSLLASAVLITLAVVYMATAAPPKGDSTSARSTPSLFSSETEASAESPKTAPAKSAAQVDSRPYTMRLDVEPQSGEDLEAAYYRYLNQHRVHPQVIRAKVRRVANDERNPQRFDEVVAILRSALRTGQIQPWMYEALGLAMRMNKMPSDEIERTLMSAADFATTPQQILFLADYMDRLGFRQRALRLLQEVSWQTPNRPDPFIKGLELATSLKDDEAIKWATLGIHRQQSTAAEMPLYDRARRAAQDLIARLRREGKHGEADRFALQLKESIRRDLVVKVTWVGDADVDLAVQEPSGSICSYRQPRTAGGGVLVGDPSGSLDRSAGEGFSEIYVCPQAFSGNYRVLLRQVWGRIPAGKVTVDVWSHLGSDKAVRHRKIIPLEENGALVALDLENGRRQESIADSQIANDISNQVAVNRAILAQQIGALANSDVIQAQQIANQAQQPFVIGNTPVVNNGAVGFRPEVIVLPIGATMSVNAVISADRRYVRITALPFFSNVTAVTQYNISTGAQPDGGVFVNIDIDVQPQPDVNPPPADMDMVP